MSGEMQTVHDDMKASLDNRIKRLTEDKSKADPRYMPTGPLTDASEAAKAVEAGMNEAVNSKEMGLYQRADAYRQYGLLAAAARDNLALRRDRILNAVAQLNSMADCSKRRLATRLPGVKTNAD